MKKSLIIFPIILALTIVGFYFGFSKILTTYSLEQVNQPIASLNTIKNSNESHSGNTSIDEYPVRIKIDSIGVDADIAPMGIDNSDIIKGKDTVGTVAVLDENHLGQVAWYSPGGAPGYANAQATLLSGHYSGANPYVEAVFDKLDKLKVDDSIIITSARGDNLSYKITAVDTLTVQEANSRMASILAPNQGDKISIITCGGAWNGSSYVNRTIVTAIRN